MDPLYIQLMGRTLGMLVDNGLRGNEMCKGRFSLLQSMMTAI